MTSRIGSPREGPRHHNSLPTIRGSPWRHGRGVIGEGQLPPSERGKTRAALDDFEGPTRMLNWPAAAMRSMHHGEADWPGAVASAARDGGVRGGLRLARSPI